jgi:cation transport regulator ChaC
MFAAVATAALAVIAAGCGDSKPNGSSGPRLSVFSPQATAACLRTAGNPVMRVVEIKPTNRNGSSTGIVYARIGGRQVGVLFYTDRNAASRAFQTFKTREKVFLSTETKYKARMKAYMDATNYLNATAFIAWAGVGTHGAPKPLTPSARQRLASCLSK